jgi:hypothetical protein
MTEKADRTLKKYSPKFPEWSRDFRRFLELFNPENYITENEEQLIWASIQELYATVFAGDDQHERDQRSVDGSGISPAGCR